MSNLNVTTSTIPRLTTDNFAEWLVDIRAHLRRSKLWKYTQEDAAEEVKNKDKWEEAADVMMSTLSAEIKRKLAEEDFNNGYKMLTKLSKLLQPGGDAQFMRLTREYYTLRYNEYENKSLSDFLTRVKVLEERIDSTNVQMDNNKQTLLCLSMGLSPKYRSLIQIWSATDGMTAAKATEMLLEEERRMKDDEDLDGGLAMMAIRGGRNGGGRNGGNKPRCSYCKWLGHDVDHCWKKHPELAPKEGGKKTEGRDSTTLSF